MKSVLKKIGVLFLKPFPQCTLHLFITAEASTVPLGLGTGGNHLEPDLGYTVDVAALKSPGVELHPLLLHLCEAWHHVEEVFHFLFQSVRFFFLMQ